MPKLKFILLIVLSLITGCEKSTTPTITPILASDYMPLNIGNRWFYKSYSPYDLIDTLKESSMVEVIGDTTIEGKSYYKLQTNILGWHNDSSITPVWTYLYRCDGSKLYIGEASYDVFKIYIEADFSINESESYQLDYNMGRSGVTKMVITLVEKITDSYKFFYDYPTVSDASLYKTFKHNVGLYDEKSVSPGIGIRLTRFELK